MLDVASELVYEGDIAANDTAAKAEYKKALEVVDLLDKNLNESAALWTQHCLNARAGVLRAWR